MKKLIIDNKCWLFSYKNEDIVHAVYLHDGDEVVYTISGETARILNKINNDQELTDGEFALVAPLPFFDSESNSGLG